MAFRSRQNVEAADRLIEVRNRGLQQTNNSLLKGGDFIRAGPCRVGIDVDANSAPIRSIVARDFQIIDCSQRQIMGLTRRTRESES